MIEISLPVLRRGVPAAVAAVTALCFLRTLQNDWVDWDDKVNYLENENYRGFSPAHLLWMATTRHMGHLMPLTWLSAALDYSLWGMRPVGYHLTNLLLHAANAVLVYFVVLRLLRIAAAGPEEILRLAAGAGALFFSIHPLRVESVAWATERRDVLSGFFLLLSMLAYLRMAEWRKPLRWYLLAFLAFLCSLLSKSIGMTLPLVLLLLDFYPLARHRRSSWLRLVLEKVPFLCASAVVFSITFAAQRELGALTPLEIYAWKDRLLQPPHGLWFYFWKTLAPFGLSPLYPFRPAGLSHEFLLPLAGCVAGAAVLIGLARRFPAGIAAAASCFLLLAPALGFVRAGPQSVADRYSYLGCLPIAPLFGALFLRFAVDERRRPVAAAATLALLTGLGILTVRQIGAWRDSLTLWTHVIELEPRAHLAFYNRATLRTEAGDWTGAFDDLNRALAIDPGFIMAWNLRGVVRMHLQDLQAAKNDLERAIDLDPRYAKAWLNRGVVRMKLGDLDGAIDDYTQALRIYPDYIEAWNNRGIAWKLMGHPVAALTDWNRSLEIRPNPEAWLQRGVLRYERGEYDAAISDLTDCIRAIRAEGKEPRDPRPWFERGRAYLARLSLDPAIGDFSTVLQMVPDHVPALMNRGEAWMQKQVFAAALADFNLALRILPGNPDVISARRRALELAIADLTEKLRLDRPDPDLLGQRGILRAASGDFEGAVVDLEEALRLAPPAWEHRGTAERALFQARRERDRKR